VNTMESRFPSWQNLERLLASGKPITLRVPGQPAAFLYLCADGCPVRLVVGGANATRALPEVPAAISTSRVLTDQGVALSIGCATAELLPQFNVLLGMVLDETQLGGATPEAALTEAVGAWRRLLAASSRATEPAQAGLFGELLVVEALCRRTGPSGLDAWVGPLGEPHDFRLAVVDLEVKTTLNSRRVHEISSLQQLVPAPGRELYLLSVGLRRAAAAEGGATVWDIVDRVRFQLVGDPLRAGRFERLLAQSGCTTVVDTETVPFLVHLPPAVLRIDEHAPRLTPAVLQAGLGPLAPRVVAARYSLDVDGFLTPVAASALADSFQFEVPDAPA
jgi:Putative  PD-(D/E)XK family member, (DUF4420)